MELPERKGVGGVSRSLFTSPRLSPISSHTTLSPQHFHETIRLSQRENLWRCMHEAQYPEPQLNGRRMRSQISSAAGLSTFTQRANRQLETLKRPDDAFMTRTTSSALMSPTLNRLPTESDFKRAIDKLGRVYAQGGVESLKLSLQEGKSHEITLEAEDKMYARISLLGQLCPLVINIVRTRGRLVAYLSKTVQEPMEMICDTKVTGDRIWLSDASTKFRSSTLYICFLALEESAFTLNVQFGKKKRTVAKEKWKPENTVSSTDEWEQLFGSFTEHKPKFSTNFIAKNRVLQSADSAETISHHLKKLMDLDIRRQEALKRWHQQLRDKKQRALDVLNRQQIKEIERQKQMEIARENAFVCSVQQKCLAMICAVQSFEGLLEKFHLRKAAIAVDNRKFAAARRLQIAYRRHMHGSSGKQIGQIRAALSMKLLVQTLHPVLWPGKERKLFQLIKLTAKWESVPINFSKFYRRSNP